MLFVKQLGRISSRKTCIKGLKNRTNLFFLWNDIFVHKRCTYKN